MESLTDKVSRLLALESGRVAGGRDEGGIGELLQIGTGLIARRPRRGIYQRSTCFLHWLPLLFTEITTQLLLLLLLVL